MLDQFFGSILSKVGEIIAECAVSKLKLITSQTLQNNLKSLTAKACDVEEQIKHAERSGQKKRKRVVEDWLEQVKSIETEVVELGNQEQSQGFISRFVGGGKAAQLNEQVCQLLEQTSQFGELVFDICGSMTEILLTNKIVGKAFEKNSERIWKLLETGEITSIGVHGMGGMGKTTLAKGIHNRLLETSPGRVFWVTVSQEFTIKSLQDKIGRVLGVYLSDEDSEDMRAGRLHRALSEINKAVLILDDVWEDIDLLRVGYSFSMGCCRLIVTTRSLEVCRRIGCQEVISVQKLGEDEAWNLFIETFTLGKEIDLGSQVEEIAKSVAKLCDGLPLGIVTLAASMRGQTAIHTWRNALVELQDSFTDQDGMREGQIFEVLKYSFDRLCENRGSPSKDFNSLQLCFLYLSLYPEDEEMEKERLIEEFISEGLLDARKSRRAQIDQGRVILDKLVNACLLESGVHVYLGKEFVKMHDLIRGMALKIVGGKYLAKACKCLKEIPKEEDWRNDIEKVSLMNNEIRRIGDGTSPNWPNLSTLLLRFNPLVFMSDSFFSRMRGLCFLDLRCTNIIRLPDSLSHLNTLEALLLDWCGKLEYVPNLGNLKALRELSLSHTAIKEVPLGVDELLNLKFLSLEGCKVKVLPRGMLTKLVNLQYLSLPRHLEVDIEEVENLKELEEFRGRVKNVRDFNIFITSRVRDTFYWFNVGVPIDEYNFPNGYDRGLVLSEYSLEDEKVMTQTTEYLRIRRCEGLSKCLSDDFNNLTSLRMLKIEECGDIECIWKSSQESASPISSVEVIELEMLEEFHGLIGTPGLAHGVFTSLRKLCINECCGMRKLGLPVLGFPNLEDICICLCDQMEEIFEDEEGGCVSLPKLKWLVLHRLPRLESVCKAIMECNSIHKIRISECPRLNKKLPVHLDVPPPPTLRCVMVDREWWESLEWDNPHLPNLLKSSLIYSIANNIARVCLH